jgi:hypothetical protein
MSPGSESARCTIMTNVTTRWSRHRTRILCIGEDALLLRSRELLLKAAGYEVVLARSNALVEEGVIRECDLALLCHSIGSERTRRLMKTLQEIHPALPSLVVADLGGGCPKGLSSTLPDPRVLLGNVARMTASSRLGQELPQQSEDKVINFTLGWTRRARPRLPLAGGDVYAFPHPRQ